MSAKQQAEHLKVRLASIEQLLSSDPARAETEAAALLASVPGQPMALLLRGIAHRLTGRPASAIEILTSLCQSSPDAPLPHLQLGLAQREAGDNGSAVQSMRRAVALKPDFSDAWLALADVLTAMRDTDGADHAYGMYIKHSLRDPRLHAAATALRENRTPEAETILREHLGRHPNDVAALCMLADVAARHARLSDAELLLARCLELAPNYRAARHNYAVVLMREDRPADALREIDRLLADEPSNLELRKLRAAVLMRVGEYEGAIGIYEGLLRDRPDRPKVWTSLGHALRAVGHRDQCVEAYRKAISLEPNFGEAYWNLANLKTFQATDAELASMREQLQSPAAGYEDRIHFQFAIGKALEDRGAFEESFQHYAEGNRLRRQSLRYDADALSDLVRRSKALFTPAFFAERSAWGNEASDPIFIVGLPRAGSTLVEQILASHCAVEGTMELPHLMAIAQSLAERSASAAPYPNGLASVTQEELRALGQTYIERTRIHRRRGTPFFIDKMPNNFLHVGVIHLMLPNARIIDVRRHPLACGLSLFKHLFSQGQPFSYSLEEIGRYYRDYVELMAHFDAVLPGRVHRVVYESLVENLDTEVHRLLEYCGLPFEDACLNFHDTERAVSTPSSEQVRTPIFRDALEHWRHYESWLDPLKAQLGQIVDTYPRLPGAS